MNNTAAIANMPFTLAAWLKKDSGNKANMARIDSPKSSAKHPEKKRVISEAKPLKYLYTCCDHDQCFRWIDPALFYLFQKAIKMIIHYVRTSLHNLLKQKVLAAINVFGFSIGIGCSILFSSYVINEFSFNDFHAEAKNIYWVYE